MYKGLKFSKQMCEKNIAGTYLHISLIASVKIQKISLNILVVQLRFTQIDSQKKKFDKKDLSNLFICELTRV